MGNCIAIGDVHGCLHELQELIEVLERDGFLKKDSRLVFVGDYVDRGPDPAGVVEYCVRLSEQYECVFLGGNHDVQFLRHLKDCHRFQPANGEFETILAYCDGDLKREDVGVFVRFAELGLPLDEAVARTGEALGKRARLRVPPAHLDFLRGLYPYWTSGRLVFCHGGVKKEWGSFERALRPENQWKLMTARGDAEDFLRQDKRVQIVGHRRRDDVTVRGWICMIDTGCISGNSLSALIIPDGWSSVFDFSIRQVRSRQNWRYVYWDRIKDVLPERYAPPPLRREYERRPQRRKRPKQRSA